MLETVQDLRWRRAHRPGTHGFDQQWTGIGGAFGECMFNAGGDVAAGFVRDERDALARLNVQADFDGVARTWAELIGERTKEHQENCHSVVDE